MSFSPENVFTQRQLCVNENILVQLWRCERSDVVELKMIGKKIDVWSIPTGEAPSSIRQGASFSGLFSSLKLRHMRGIRNRLFPPLAQTKCSPRGCWKCYFYTACNIFGTMAALKKGFNSRKTATVHIAVSRESIICLCRHIILSIVNMKCCKNEGQSLTARQPFHWSPIRRQFRNVWSTSHLSWNDVVP